MGTQISKLQFPKLGLLREKSSHFSSFAPHQNLILDTRTSKIFCIHESLRLNFYMYMYEISLPTEHALSFFTSKPVPQTKLFYPLKLIKYLSPQNFWAGYAIVLKLAIIVLDDVNRW